MTRLAKLAAVAATAAALALPAQAPAATQTNPCLEDPTVPTCVNWTFDTVDRIVTQPPPIPDVDPIVNRVACIAYWAATGRTCPYVEL